MSKGRSIIVSQPLYINESTDNLTGLRKGILLTIFDNPGNEIAPLVLSITRFQPGAGDA